MNRTGLIIALVIAAAAGLTFGLYPQLELQIAQRFYEVADVNKNMFAWRIYPPAMFVRDTALWVGTVIIAPVIGALVLKLVLPKRKMLVPGRAVLFLIATMALGPGLLVNVVLKEHWGRPRPIDVTQFGGEHQYVRWWDPRGDCPSNCSFVSGDVSGAYWTLAPAALTPPQWRVVAYGAALALGSGMGALRVMAGGHFVSDVIFSGVFTFLIIWLMYALIYRWPPTRQSDARIERAIERFAMPGYKFFSAPFAPSRARQKKSPGKKARRRR